MAVNYPNRMLHTGSARDLLCIAMKKETVGPRASPNLIDQQQSSHLNGIEIFSSWAVSNFVSEENLVLLGDYRNYTLFIWFRRKVRINTIRKAQLNRFWRRVLVCVIELLWFGMRYLIGCMIGMGLLFSLLVQQFIAFWRGIEKQKSYCGAVLIGMNEPRETRWCLQMTYHHHGPWTFS